MWPPGNCCVCGQPRRYARYCGPEGCVHQTRKPTPPRDVRVERPDGTTIPCEIVYDGERIADDGGIMDEWVAVTPVALGLEDRVRVGMLPARCSIVVRLAE